MAYTIGEVAQVLGVATSALRYYDREGLLPDLGRSPRGTRVFGEEDLGALRVIDCLKRSGMQIKDIRQFMDWHRMGDETLTLRRDLFNRCRRQLLDQMAELQGALDMAEYKCWYYSTADDLGSEAAVQDLPDEQIPEPVRGARARSQCVATPA